MVPRRCHAARECRRRAGHDLRRSEIDDRPYSSHANQDCGERDKEHRLREGAKISRQAHDAELLTKGSRGLPSGFYEAVRAKIGCGIGMHQFCEPVAGTVDAALDGSNDHPTDFRGFFVGQALCADEQNRFALLWGKPRESRSEVREIKVSSLLRRNDEPLRIGTIHVLHLTPTTPMVRVEEVAQYGEEPSLEVCARLKARDMGEATSNRVLNEVVSVLHVSYQ